MNIYKCYLVTFFLPFVLFHPSSKASHIGYKFPRIEGTKSISSAIPAKRSTPSWLKLESGLFFLCKCDNPRCPAGEESVAVNFGYGTFNVVEHFFDGDTQCSACSEKIYIEMIKKVGFNRCDYKVKGALISDIDRYREADPPSQKDWTEPFNIKDSSVSKNKIHYYRACEPVYWVFLSISAVVCGKS